MIDTRLAWTTMTSANMNRRMNSISMRWTASAPQRTSELVGSCNPSDPSTSVGPHEQCDKMLERAGTRLALGSSEVGPHRREADAELNCDLLRHAPTGQ